VNQLRDNNSGSGLFLDPDFRLEFYIRFGKNLLFFFSSRYCLMDSTQMPPNLLKFVQLLCRAESVPLVGLGGLAAVAREALGYPLLMLSVDRAAPAAHPFERLNTLVSEIWQRAGMAADSKDSSAASHITPSAKNTSCPAVALVSDSAKKISSHSWLLPRRADGQPAFVIPAN
jgi:hypothetical protein